MFPPQVPAVLVAELDPTAPVPPGTTLLDVCHSGGRSARATAWLNQAGYDAVNLDGGMVDWARAGLPVV